jgi:hypothetical protein
MPDIRTAIAAFLAAALSMAGSVFAAANVQSVRGDVRAGATQLAVNDRVTSGATITTGAGAQVVLRFDDGQQVVLNENTVFKITEFRYRAAEPGGDKATFDLLRGALRMITGLVGARNRDNVQLRLPQATIGIRGTDFMVAIVNPAFTSVLNGAIAVSNAGGTTVFGAGAIGSVASPAALAVSIPASALPPAASAAFSSMGAAAGVTAGGMAAGAPPAPAAMATTGTGAAGVIAVGVGLAVGLGALNDEDDQPSSTTHH